MAKVLLPPGCLGFKAQDGTRILAENGAGSFAHVPDKYMTALKNNDYAQAGLVDAGAEKFFVKKSSPGRYCRHCRFTGYAWMENCSKCGEETIPEQDVSRELPAGQYIP